VDLRAQPDGLLARADLGLTTERLGLARGLATERLRLAPGLVEHQPPLLLRGAEARLPEHADRDRDRDAPHDDPDQNSDCDQHAQLLGRLTAVLPRSPPRRSAGIDVR